jgi:hypothetical protein
LIEKALVFLSIETIFIKGFLSKTKSYKNNFVEKIFKKITKIKNLKIIIKI